MKRQSGFSLMEMMVALTVGLILIGGTGQIFLSGKQSFGVQEGMGNLQEAARFAQFFLQRDIRMAGYPRVDGPPAFNVGGTADGGGNASDAIEVQFQSNVDCLGRAVASGFVRNRYSVDASQNRANRAGVAINSGRLMCRSWQIGANGALIAEIGSQQPLVEGIETLQLLYGEDTNVPTDGFANRYLRADQVTNWNNVVSVRVGILASTLENVDVQASAQSYVVLDAPLFQRNDSLRRRSFVSTIEIRNRTP